MLQDFDVFAVTKCIGNKMGNKISNKTEIFDIANILFDIVNIFELSVV